MPLPMTIFPKPVLTADEQVDLLVRRGMIVNDRQRALHCLQHINYYRLRAYWLPDEVVAAPGHHAFRAGTDFDRIINLYNFDRNLRLLVMDAIECVEISVRTGWAYVLAHRFGASAHEDSTLFTDYDTYASSVNNLKSELGRSKEKFVAHHRRNYPNHPLLPIWAACEVLSFNQLSVWFENLVHAPDRVEIAKPLRIDEQVLSSFLHHLTYVRNVCAHHGRLWNREITITMKIPRRPADWAADFNAHAPTLLYNTLVMLALLVSQISPQNTWCSKLKALISEYPGVDITSMGFRADWHSLSCWDNPKLTPSN